MKEWTALIAEYVVIIIHAMVLLIIVIGTVQAFARSIPAIVNPSANGHHFRTGYSLYARWLIAGLTFQLAADIIESSFAPKWEWDDIGRLAAISVIRTFLNYFLERDLAEVERREAELRQKIAKEA